jgi:hypothetical protein
VLRSVVALTLGKPALVLVLVGTLDCRWNDQSPAAQPEPLFLSPVAEIVQLRPGAMARVAFLLTTLHGAGVAGERLEFSATDGDLAGALLSAMSGLTDADGIGSLTVTGGLRASFQVTARQTRAGIARARVMVDDRDPGTIAVVAAPAVGAQTASSIASVDILLFDNLVCSHLSPMAPPQPAGPMRTVAPGTPAEFTIDSAVMLQRAVVGQGRDQDRALIAVGCVDLPSSAVVSGSTVRVYLPLSDLVPTPRGTFLLSSRFSLAKRDLTRRMAAPWQDLGDCPLDPGQLWLDCAIDALGALPDDPLDCIPSPAGEGALASLILARRGNATAGSPCRAATLGDGTQGLDAKVAALFPSPAQPPASDIDALGTAVASILDDFLLDSTLAVESTPTPGLFHATHTLRSALFQTLAPPTAVDIVALGAPNVQVRFVPVHTMGDLLTIEAHGLGLHIGTLAHAAFAKVVFTSRGLPAATSAYLDVLFALATSGTGATGNTGCDALDQLVCAEVGAVAGCLRAACVAGQAALAQRLDDGFALADGEGADFQLSGSALMNDDDHDGFVDRLGASPPPGGSWSSQFRARAGTEIVSGSWSGKIPPTP